MDADEYKNNLITSAKHIFEDLPTNEGPENNRYVKSSINQHIKTLKDNASAIPGLRGYGVSSLLSIVNSGNDGLRKIQEGESDLSKKELLGLESIISITGRPAILVNNNKFLEAPPGWEKLEQNRKMIEEIIPSVGRINLKGHPNLNWTGTGFLVGEDVIMTNKHVMLDFCRQDSDDNYSLRSDISSSIDFGQDLSNKHNVFEIKEVVGAHKLDLGLLRISNVPINGGIKPRPLALSKTFVNEISGRSVFIVGFPWIDDRIGDPQDMINIFGHIYGYKRVQPGELLKMSDSAIVDHDCSTLGGNSGSCLVDLETSKVIGLHFKGKYLVANNALALWKLANESPLNSYSINFQ